MKNKKFKFAVLLTGAALAKPTWHYVRNFWDKVASQVQAKSEVSQVLTWDQDSVEGLERKINEMSEKSKEKIDRNLAKLERIQEMVRKLKEAKNSKPSLKDSVFFDFGDIESEISDFQCNLSLELSEISCSSALLEEDSRISIRNNRLLKMYNPKVKSSIRLQYLIKSIEAILTNKFKDDLAALEKNREPLSMPEYLYQSLYKESPVLADKKICEILNTFKEHQHDLKVRFYCRLFQVFDVSPISFKLSLYLIKMRHFFNVFISKQVIPENLKKRVDKMQVIVILKSTRKLFNSDVPTGRIVLKHLKPESLSSVVWTVTCIEYYLYYRNILPADCFADISKGDTITEGEFVHLLTSVHDTYIQESDLHDLFSSKSTGLMSKSEFNQLFDLDSFFKRNQTYLIDQLQFLNALIEGYTSMRIRHYKEVESLISRSYPKKQILSNYEAGQVLQQLCSSFDPNKLLQSMTEIHFKDLRKKIFELNVGGRGIGCYNLRSIERISDIFDE